MGLQHKTIDELTGELGNLASNQVCQNEESCEKPLIYLFNKCIIFSMQVLALFHKVVRKLSIKVNKILLDNEQTDDKMNQKKENVLINRDVTEKTLDEDLADHGDINMMLGSNDAEIKSSLKTVKKKKKKKRKMSG